MKGTSDCITFDTVDGLCSNLEQGSTDCIDQGTTDCIGRATGMGDG